MKGKNDLVFEAESLREVSIIINKHYDKRCTGIKISRKDEKNVKVYNRKRMP